MFETVLLHTRVEADGHLRVDLPTELPPESDVDLTLSIRTRTKFMTPEEWRTRARRVIGSIPDIERPPDLPAPDVEPL